MPGRLDGGAVAAGPAPRPSSPLDPAVPGPLAGEPIVNGSVLAAIAEGLAAAQPQSILPAGNGRRWAPLAATGAYSAWVIAWPAGTGLGLHDHDGSTAAVHIVSGTLRERFVLGNSFAVRWLGGASTVLLPPDHVHEVVNVGSTESISVHVYSPPLLDTSFRDDPEIDLR